MARTHQQPPPSKNTADEELRNHHTLPPSLSLISPPVVLSAATHTMAADSCDSAEVEKLNDFSERLNESMDKSKNVSDYEGILSMVKGRSVKAKQLAAQLILRFFKFFPSLASKAMTAQLDLIKEDELAIRVQSISGLPLLCKDNSEHVSKIVDVLGQLLVYEENVERDAVHKALMSLLRQDVKASLTALFKHVEIGIKSIREMVICFLKDKVFPLKVELLKPQAEMERHVTDLVKKSLTDVTGAKFKFFMDLLKSFSIFAEDAFPDRIEELIDIFESQADLDAECNVDDIDHIDRLTSCMSMALPFFMRGASCSKFLSYFNKHIIPVFDKFPEEKKIDLLKTLAGCSPYSLAQDSRQLLPSIVRLLKKYMPRKKTEEVNLHYVECLLFTFHHLSHKTPNSINSLCGYKIVTGQPSDRLGEDFSENYEDFNERLSSIEDAVKVAMTKLTQGMAEHDEAMSTAMTEDAKKLDQQKTFTGLHVCNNILEMTRSLHSKVPTFIGGNEIKPSWKEPAEAAPAAAASTAGCQQDAYSIDNAKMEGGAWSVQNQLVNKASEGLGNHGSDGGYCEWSSLIPDVLRHISQKLSLIFDYLSFRAVCFSWRSAADLQLLPPQSPLLMVPYSPNNDPVSNNDHIRELFFLKYRRLYYLSVPEACNTRCLTSNHGWLLVLPTHPNIFLNPFTRARIALPPFTTMPGAPLGTPDDWETDKRIWSVGRTLISSSPATDDECVVMVWLKTSKNFTFCRPRDNLWAEINNSNRGVKNMAYYDGKFYASYSDGSFAVIDVRDRRILIIPSSWVGNDIYYLVGSDAGLFLIRWDRIVDDNGGLYFTVYKIHMDAEGVAPRWERILNLDGESLFLCHGLGFSVRGTDCPGVKPNCIYCSPFFEMQNYEGGPHVIVFNMEDGSNELINCYGENNLCWFDCGWFRPSLS